MFHDEYIVERRDGTRVVLSRNITALRDADGTYREVATTLAAALLVALLSGGELRP